MPFASKRAQHEKLALVQAWAEAGHLFSERERAALAWAEAVTRVSETGVPADDSSYATGTTHSVDGGYTTA
jgi:alkylhydroperoxidase family enzyme